MPYKSEKVKIAGTQFDLRRKLSPEQVRAVSILSSQGYSQRQLATMFGCSKSTIQHILQHWNWATTWGWDFGMTAMAAARLNQPDEAIRILLSDYTKNTYLLSGHNFQTADRLRIYLPGNGALLTAISMMCAGWDGCPEVNNPGFPHDGTWNVRWEGLQRMQ